MLRKVEGWGEEKEQQGASAMWDKRWKKEICIILKCISDIPAILIVEYTIQEREVSTRLKRLKNMELQRGCVFTIGFNLPATLFKNILEDNSTCCHYKLLLNLSSITPHSIQLSLPSPSCPQSIIQHFSKTSHGSFVPSVFSSFSTSSKHQQLINQNAGSPGAKSISGFCGQWGTAKSGGLSSEDGRLCSGSQSVQAVHRRKIISA